MHSTGLLIANQVVEATAGAKACEQETQPGNFPI
jgi:hypothetical protein